MRIRKKTGSGIVEFDLTPMIDMTFQLIAFFMFALNFTQVEYNQEVQLPESQLAKPPDAPFDYPITLHMTQEGHVVIGGERVTQLSGLLPYLEKERTVLRLKEMPITDATIIIRADRNAPTGKVQELIQVCQQKQFENFALRAEEDLN